jgi:hypothetical protein
MPTKEDFEEKKVTTYYRFDHQDAEWKPIDKTVEKYYRPIKEVTINASS